MISLKIINGQIVPYSEKDKKEIEKLKDNAIYGVKFGMLDKRTLQQNKLIHVFCNNVASALNNQGKYITDVIQYETQWSMQKVKDLIYRPVMEKIYDKKSTTKLNRDELNDIFDTVIQALASKKIDTKGLL